MTLEDYLDIYKSMINDVFYYRKVGYKVNNIKIIASTDRAIALYETALKSQHIDTAEMYYNELRGELFVCEEIVDEIGYQDNDDD